MVAPRFSEDDFERPKYVDVQDRRPPDIQKVMDEIDAECPAPLPTKSIEEDIADGVTYAKCVIDRLCEWSLTGDRAEKREAMHAMHAMHALIDLAGASHSRWIEFAIRIENRKLNGEL